jgi:hypothetical protein
MVAGKMAAPGAQPCSTYVPQRSAYTEDFLPTRLFQLPVPTIRKPHIPCGRATWNIFPRSSPATSICTGRITSTCRHRRSGSGNCPLTNHSIAVRISSLALFLVPPTASFLGLSVVNFVGGPNRPCRSYLPETL